MTTRSKPAERLIRQMTTLGLLVFKGALISVQNVFQSHERHNFLVNYLTSHSA